MGYQKKWKSFVLLPCEKEVPYRQNGINQVNQHARSQRHKKNWENKNPYLNKQKRFLTVRGEMALSKPMNRAVMEAEIIWIFKLAEEDWSFA